MMIDAVYSTQIEQIFTDKKSVFIRFIRVIRVPNQKKT
jgi:hypothetical protein